MSSMAWDPSYLSKAETSAEKSARAIQCWGTKKHKQGAGFTKENL